MSVEGLDAPLVHRPSEPLAEQRSMNLPLTYHPGQDYSPFPSGQGPYGQTAFNQRKPFGQAPYGPPAQNADAARHSNVPWTLPASGYGRMRYASGEQPPGGEEMDNSHWRNNSRMPMWMSEPRRQGDVAQISPPTSLRSYNNTPSPNAPLAISSATMSRNYTVSAQEPLLPRTQTLYTPRAYPSANEEVLRTGFRVRQSPKNFFKVGKVFMVLWIEPAGGSAGSSWQSEPSLSSVRYGESAYSKIRRFVVIREGQKYSNVIPIVTYGGRGVGRPGTIKSEHAIVYSGKECPGPLPDELPTREGGGLLPIAIRVDMDGRSQSLDPLSRLNFGKTYTIEHNVKVQSLGRVNLHSCAAFIEQFCQVWMASFPAARWNSAISTDSPVIQRNSKLDGLERTSQCPKRPEYGSVDEDDGGNEDGSNEDDGLKELSDRGRNGEAMKTMDNDET